MSGISKIGSYLSGATNLLRFIPEPQSRVAATFGNVLQTVGQVASEGVGGMVGIDPSYQALLQKQISMQEQLQMVTMESNIEKTKHESKMTAVRNFRAG
jgi:hypothetical protein